MQDYQLRQRDYLLEISRAMTSRLDLPSLLELTLKSAVELLRGQAGLIVLQEPDGVLRVRASYGEGFKVPSLYQLYSFYGDTSLQPETSKGYDIGLEKGRRDGTFFAGVSLFRRDSRNLIDFDLVSYSYYNIGKARSEGVELELGARPSDNLRAGLVYTYVKSTDRTAGGIYEGNDLNRRPRNTVTASLDWTAPVAGVALGGDIRMVGDSFDDRGEWTRLDGYQTVDLRASLPLGAVEVFGRVENVFDEGYETVAGYNTAGRSAYVGARLSI